MGNIKSIELIVIGASYGGIEALTVIFRNMSKIFKIPVIVVYHRGKESNSGYLEKYFSEYTTCKIREIEDNESIHQGTIYIAPADYHVLLEDFSSISLVLDDPVNYSRPSIDLLFISAGKIFKNHVMAVLLTGANSDGACGISHIAGNGGYTIVQNPAEALIPVMPQSALDICEVDEIANLDKISEIMNQANSCFIKEVNN